jgi:O-acetyl-ADP-ribose deacetylase (regulator of RNase III)
MIKAARGDILAADVEALVNTVNTVGVMGRGVALQFKKAFPDNFKAYEAACKRHEVETGRMFVFDAGRMMNPRWIINFPTKQHWRGDSQMVFVTTGLAALVADIKRLGIKTIAVPPLGCGLGGLNWADVRPLIVTALESIPGLEAHIYEPGGVPAAKEMKATVKIPPMTVGRAALVGLMHRYLTGLMEPFVSLLELHKLMYFLQVDGEPLKLTYRKHIYGPYAENLRHVLSAVEGHLLTGYADGGDAPDKQLELIPAAVPKALAFLDAHPAAKARFDRVVDLVEGFETPFGMELLATVHWVVAHEGATSADQAITRIKAWNSRKAMFKPEQVRIAWDVLDSKGWLTRQSKGALSL